MIFEQFSKIGIIPVIEPDNAKDAAKLSEILSVNGLPCAEITFTNEAAEESVRVISREFPDILVGAGTILTTDQADRAMNAGAKFIVSPGLNPKIVQYCIDNSIPVTPGVQTPSEIEQALELGINVVQFFPAEQAGGLAMIQALAGAYGGLQFMPSGVIGAKSLRGYLAYDRIVACGCRGMIGSELVSSGEWDKVSAIVKEAASIVKEARG